MAVFLGTHAGFSAVRGVVAAAAVTFVGLALIVGPGMLRLVRQLGVERRERIRSEERAEMAAHLHDSVLQSLAMIQRAASPEQMASLARAQERELRTWLTPDLLILDDFGLRKLSPQESGDFYDVLVERDRHAATAITSNRAVDEWVALFDDPILANSALDRFAHRAHQIVMEGPSLRAARAPSPARGPRRPSQDSAPGG